jgi:putative oxidoreductase
MRELPRASLASAARAERGPSMTDIAARAEPRSNSTVALIVDKLVALCAVIPYSLIALGLRFVMARIFFLSGQGKIDGPVVPVPLGVHDLEFSVVLPAQIKDSTFQMFETQYANLPIAPTTAAYLFSYAEFVLPICLVLGFATRFAALGLLVMTLLLQFYVLPGMWWPAHVYWVSILLVLMSAPAPSPSTA